jgi:hypothetical protein
MKNIINVVNKLVLPKTIMVLLVIFASTVGANGQDPFWTQVKGPFSGSLWAMAVMSDGTYYAGTGDGRVFRKLSGQDTWTLSTSSFENQTILSFYEDDNKVFVGDANGGLQFTEDNGETWESATVGIAAGSQIRDMLRTDTDFLLGTGSGMYRKTLADGKIVWELTNFTTPRGKFIMSLAQDDDGILYAGTGSGVFRSSDNGATWEGFGFFITATTVFSVATHNGDVYVGTSQGVYVHREGQPVEEWVTLAKMITKESFGVRNVSVINDRVYISVTGVGTYYSDDDVNWTQLPHLDARAGFFADEDKLVIGTLDGVWTSSLENPLNNSVRIGAPEHITMLTSVQSRMFAVARYGVLYEAESPRMDDQWTPTFRIHSEGSIRCYAETPDGNRYINLTGAATGAQLFGFTHSPDQQGYDAVPFPSEVARFNQIFVTSKDTILIPTNSGLYHFNRGTLEIKRLSKVTVLGKEILFLEEDIAGNIYAATPEGFYVSDDEGKTWSASKLLDTKVDAILLTGDKQGYVGTDKGLYYFTDLNSEPTQVDDFIDVTSIVKDLHGHLYMVANREIYYKPSADSRWELQANDMEELYPTKLIVADNFVYVATNGGLFKHKYAEYAPISLTGLGYFDYDGSTRVATAITNPSPLSVNITYNKLSEVPQGSGKYKVRATIVDDVYVGEAFGEITIGGMPAEIFIQAGTDFIYDGLPHGATATSVPENLNVRITYNDHLDVPVNAGTYIVKAEVVTANYSAAKYDTIVIDKAQQEITFEPLSDRLVADGTFELVATSSVGLNVTFNISEGPASISGKQVELKGAGMVKINAVQSGSVNYYAANTVTRKFYVWEDVIQGTEDALGKFISVYPIPSSNTITVKCDQGSIRAIDIIDGMGRTINHHQFEDAKNMQEISVANFPAGLFMLRISTNEHKTTVRHIEIIK